MGNNSIVQSMDIAKQSMSQFALKSIQIIIDKS
jgi:hypothetical protein